MKTLSETIVDMKSEVKWFRRAAGRHALNASKTVIGTTKISELIEQEIHTQMAEKLANWVERLEKLDETGS